MLGVEPRFQRQDFRLQCLTGPLPFFQSHPVFPTDLPTGGSDPAVKVCNARVIWQKPGMKDANSQMAEDGNVMPRQPIQDVIQGFRGELRILGNRESRLR